MNKKQKIIIAIAVPVILFLITFTIAYYIGETVSGPGKIGMGKPRLPSTYTKINNPFLWSLTWYVWITYFIIIFIFEYKFFSDKNIPNNKKK